MNKLRLSTVLSTVNMSKI